MNDEIAAIQAWEKRLVEFALMAVFAVAGGVAAFRLVQYAGTRFGLRGDGWIVGPRSLVAWFAGMWGAASSVSTPGGTSPPTRPSLPATRRSDLVFSGPGGGRLWHFSGRFFRTVRALGLGGTGLNIHSLRHTFASRFAEATGDLLLQRVGGWSSLTLVQRYAHVREGRGAEAIRQMLAAHDGAAPQPAPVPSTIPLRATGRSRRS